MKLRTICLSLAITAVPAFAQMTPAKVDAHDVKPAIKLEQPVKGFLTALNDKLKLRATEIEFAPGGHVGDHLHAGPGIRYVAAGELTITDESGKEQVAKQGDYFYESGDQSLQATNKSGAPARLIVVELLPADWSGSAMVPLSRRADLATKGRAVQQSVCGK